jgi:hypothetical protein
MEQQISFLICFVSFDTSFVLFSYLTAEFILQITVCMNNIELPMMTNHCANIKRLVKSVAPLGQIIQTPSSTVLASYQ